LETLEGLMYVTLTPLSDHRAPGLPACRPAGRPWGPAGPDLRLAHVLLDGQKHVAFGRALCLFSDGTVWSHTSGNYRLKEEWRRVPESRWHEYSVGGRPLRELVSEKLLTLNQRGEGVGAA
jgi:hypothetical protein